MQLSAAGLDFIKRAEGFRSRKYLDVAGIPTIGYGHRLLNHDSFPDGPCPDEIDEPQAAAILAADLREAEQAVQRLVKVPLTQGQFDALVDFCFNLGEGRLASSTLLSVLNRGRYDAAAEQLLRWDFAAGKENAALESRRQGDHRMWTGNSSSRQAAA